MPDDERARFIADDVTLGEIRPARMEEAPPPEPPPAGPPAPKPPPKPKDPEEEGGG